MYFRLNLLGTKIILFIHDNNLARKWQEAGNNDPKWNFTFVNIGLVLLAQ